MANFNSESKPPVAARYRVLVNGFANGKYFPTLPHAVDSAPKGVKSLSFEIYDALERRFVWSQARQLDGRSPSGAFSIRVNGHSNGLSFGSLLDVVDFILVRPPGHEFAVFEDETCVFMQSYSQSPNLVEAI